MEYRAKAIRIANGVRAAAAIHIAQVAVAQAAASIHIAHSEIAAARVRVHKA